MTNEECFTLLCIENSCSENNSFVTCTMSLHSYLFSRQCLASAQRRETRSTPVIHLYYLKRKCIQWNSLSNWHLHKYSRLFVFFSSSKVISSPYVIARWDTCDTAFSFWQFFLSLPLPLRESPLAEEWAQWWPLIVWCLSRHSRRLKSTSSMDKHWVSSDISHSLHFTGDANGTLCIFAMNSICHIETINCLSKIEFARSLNFSFLSFSLPLLHAHPFSLSFFERSSFFLRSLFCVSLAPFFCSQCLTFLSPSPVHRRKKETSKHRNICYKRRGSAREGRKCITRVKHLLVCMVNASPALLYFSSLASSLFVTDAG